MPELPEVETVKRGLAAAMTGRVISQVEVRRPDLRIPFPMDFVARLKGRKIEQLWRRAKYIVVNLDNGQSLIAHLGMSGRFAIFGGDGQTSNLAEFYFEQPSDQAADGPHDHVVFTLNNGTRIVYTDPRRFGLMDLCPTAKLDEHRLLRNLGVEPLGNELNASYLRACLENRRIALKTALLDQQIIAGLGNIYVCEVLNRTRLSPKRLAGSLAGTTQLDPRLERIAREIRAVLQEAITVGGSTLRDYVAPDGTGGNFQQRFCVYGREGEACRNEGCKGIVRRIAQAGRSTFYCPRCQR